MSGQLALTINGEGLAPAAVWETLLAESQKQVAMRLAMLLAQMVEAERDE